MLSKNLLDEAALPMESELYNMFMAEYADSICDSQAGVEEAAIIFFKLYIDLKLSLVN